MLQDYRHILGGVEHRWTRIPNAKKDVNSKYFCHMLCLEILRNGRPLFTHMANDAPMNKVNEFEGNWDLLERMCAWFANKHHGVWE